MATSERYYAAIKRGRAGKRIRHVWKENRMAVRQKGAIDDDNEVTG